VVAAVAYPGQAPARTRPPRGRQFVSRSVRVITIRSIATDELDAWLALTADDPTNALLERRVRSAWADGRAGPDLTFLAEGDGTPVGRMAYIPNPVGTVMPEALEALLAGLWLPWDRAGDAVEIGVRLIRETLERLGPPTIAVDATANPEYQAGAEIRRAIFEDAGLPLLQEKEGFVWRPASSPAPPANPRLRFRSILETGEAAYAALLSRCVVGTLDRQDHYYRELVGVEAWGREMITFVTAADARSWLLAETADGTAVGYVALGDFDDAGRGTIQHIGVAPEHRGHGYVNDLLAACNGAALARGYDHVLSDVDVLNAPMMAAMERAGHHAAATPWHVHHYRLDLGR